MNIVVTSEQMKIAERYMIEELGLPSLVLMEKAAEKVFELSRKVMEDMASDSKKICVLCGGGNNGGDGLAVARMMHQKGIDVTVCVVGNESHCTEEFVLQKSIFEKLGGKIVAEPDYSANLFIDAMLGIGISGEVRGRYSDVINRLNEVHSADGRTVISIDIPSGLNADNGLVMGCAVDADYTYCLGYHKTGLLLNEGQAHTGKLLIDNIGIEPPTEYSAKEYELEDIKEIFPPRKIISNKSTYGKVTIIAGSEGMPGAACLASKAALTAGVGMVKLLTDNSVIPLIVSSIPEVMVDRYNNRDSIITAIDWCDALLIGPGLGRSKEAEELFIYVMENCKKPIVIDADGLYHLSSHLDLLAGREKNSTILTPHPGEFNRLFGTEKEERKHQNIGFLKELSCKYNATILAKDHNSLITDGDSISINTFGTDALATAGTGDVLAGIVLAELVNTKSTAMSCIIGAAVHGLAGTAAADKTNDYAVSASDVLSSIPEAVRHIKNK